MSDGEENRLNDGPGDSAWGMREGRGTHACGSRKPKECTLPLFRSEKGHEQDWVAIWTVREDILLSCHKSTFEQDVRNCLNGVSTGTGQGRFQMGKSGEERTDMGMAGEKVGEEGKVLCLIGRGDRVGERKSCQGW